MLRYANILPYSDTISHPTSHPYFNANFITLPPITSPLLIATQSPPRHTLPAFYQLIK
jgi:protein tyrosine phosphatase